MVVGLALGHEEAEIWAMPKNIWIPGTHDGLSHEDLWDLWLLGFPLPFIKMLRFVAVPKDHQDTWNA